MASSDFANLETWHARRGTAGARLIRDHVAFPFVNVSLTLRTLRAQFANYDVGGRNACVTVAMLAHLDRVAKSLQL